MRFKYTIGINLFCLMVTLLGTEAKAADDAGQAITEAAIEVVKARIPQEEYEVMVSQYIEKVSGAGKKRKCPPLDVALKEFWHKKLDYDVVVVALSREFSHNFSIDELEEISEFYNTEAGKKFAQMDEAYKQHLNMKIYGEFNRHNQGMGELFMKYRPGTENCK